MKFGRRNLLILIGLINDTRKLAIYNKKLEKIKHTEQ